MLYGDYPKVNFLKGEKKRNRIYMKRKELGRMSKLVSYILGIPSKDRSSLYKLGELISNFWKKSGVIHSTKYYSEVYRLCLAYLSNESTRDLKTWVSVTRKGLPTALPLEMRNALVKLKDGSDDKYLITYIRAFFSILSFFRGVTGIKKPDYGSITKPFTGQSKTLPIEDIRRVFKYRSRPLKLAKPHFFIPNKAGANSNLVITSIGLDLLAIMDNFPIWLAYCRWCIKYHYYLLLFVFLSCSLICYPFLYLYKILILFTKLEKVVLSGPFGFLLTSLPNLHTGRLSIVKEAKQKNRVVGITDWWTQILLKPLHDALSELLRSIPEDGTFNQSKPIDLMLHNRSILGTLSDPIGSVDLSNATDRLPIDLQSDILTVLGIDGDLWKGLLYRGYFTPELDKDLVYSVGQPMGVYSSFNMLALTNHVINQVALLRAEIEYKPGTGQYAVLGDDDAGKINTSVSQYKEILAYLGVEANPIKGFDGNIVEFAKRIFYNNKGQFVELSPIGMKGLVNSIRNPYYLVTVLLDMNKKSFIYDDLISRLTTIMDKLYQKTGTLALVVIFCILGPQGGLWPNPSYNNPDFEPLNVSGINFQSVKGCFEELVINHIKTDIAEVNAHYVWQIQKLSAKTQSVSSEFSKIVRELSLLFVTLPVTNPKFNSLTKFSQYTLVIYCSLLAILISLPIIIKITIPRFFDFIIIELLKWNKVRRFGKQIPIPITLHHKPEIWDLSNFIDFFNSGMSSSNMIPYKGDEWLASFNEFKKINKLDGDDPIRYFMWDYHVSIPFNVILNKISIVDHMDQLPAFKMAKDCIKMNPTFNKDLIISEKAKRLNMKNRRNKRRSRSLGG